MNKSVLLYLIAIVCIIASGYLITFYLIQTHVAECTSDPLAYAEKVIRERTDVESVVISLRGDSTYFYFENGELKQEDQDFSNVTIEF